MPNFPKHDSTKNEVTAASNEITMLCPVLQITKKESTGDVVIKQLDMSKSRKGWEPEALSMQGVSPPPSCATTHFPSCWDVELALPF